MENVNRVIGNQKNPYDGYWILIQDWSQCTLKCGGGLQYQQLVCMPPKLNGKQCEGPAVRTRACNNQICPTILDNEIKVDKGFSYLNSEYNLTNRTELPPIVKVMPISKRPSRYDKCHIKEDDSMMVKNDQTTKSFAVLPKVPVRIVLNDKTFSVFQDDVIINILIMKK